MPCSWAAFCENLCWYAGVCGTYLLLSCRKGASWEISQGNKWGPADHGTRAVYTLTKEYHVLFQNRVFETGEVLMLGLWISCCYRQSCSSACRPFLVWPDFHSFPSITVEAICSPQIGVFMLKFIILIKETKMFKIMFYVCSSVPHLLISMSTSLLWLSAVWMRP